ncbi:MAG: hypothetical protein HQL31_13480, partial [Planctomycetes bacterium]|nr:hypothetical protein [Planctomycetota bacterium]
VMNSPSENSNSSGSLVVYASVGASDAGLGGAATTAAITVNPIADTPAIEGGTVLEDGPLSGLHASRNIADGVTTTHLKVSGITGGRLFVSEGNAEVLDGDFVDFANAIAGFVFTPTPDINGTVGFSVQAATGDSDLQLGGDIVASSIVVTPVPDLPSVSA